MKLNAIQNRNNFPNYSSRPLVDAKAGIDNILIPPPPTQKLTCENLKANFLLNFKGNAPLIKRAYIITGEEKNIPIYKTEQNKSYIVEFDTQTEVIYGKDAIEFLNKNNYFPYETQVVMPKGAKGTMTKDGKEIELKENSAVILTEDTKAQISTAKGYPFIIISKKDHNWYERHNKNAKDKVVADKFKEMVWYNSHLYSGAITPNILLEDKFLDKNFLAQLGIDKDKAKTHLLYDIYDRRDKLNDEDREKITRIKTMVQYLYDNGIIRKETEEKDEEYFVFNSYYNPEDYAKMLKNAGFGTYEIRKLIPIYNQVRKSKMASRILRQDSADIMPPHIIEKLKAAGILHNNKTKTDKIFFKRCYGNETQLRNDLKRANLSEEEINSIVDSWAKSNTSGFDVTGLWYVDEDCAVYNLKDKVNNWTLEETNWITNSTAMSSLKGTAPVDGVSLVQTDKKGFFEISELRKGETFHTHPNLNEKRQEEVYLISSGQAALAVEKNDKVEILTLKEGDLAVVGPGVGHCLLAVEGQYEQIVSQVPSAFQYATSFKLEKELPNGVKMDDLIALAQGAMTFCPISDIYSAQANADIKIEDVEEDVEE